MGDREQSDGFVVVLLAILILVLAVGGGGAAYWFVAKQRAIADVRRAQYELRRAEQAAQEAMMEQKNAELKERLEQEMQSRGSLPNQTTNPNESPAINSPEQ